MSLLAELSARVSPDGGEEGLFLARERAFLVRATPIRPSWLVDQYYKGPTVQSLLPRGAAIR